MENKKSKGLGDTVAKITKATGIKKVVETVAKVTGKDCGCAKRQKTLTKEILQNPGLFGLSLKEIEETA